MERAAIYVRVSGTNQEKGFSIQTQLDGCRERAKQQNYSLLTEHEFVESHTATVLDRPQMEKLLDLAETGVFDVLILYCIDRLSRGGPGHQWYLENEFKRHGVRVEYVTEQYENNPEGELHKHIHAAVAQYERAKIVERTTRGRKGRAKEGKFIPGGSVRYGYKYIRKSQTDPGHVEIVPEEAEVVKLIFFLYVVEQLGLRTIAKRLTELGVPTRFDTTARRKLKKHVACFWGWTSIANILAYEGYVGVHYFNVAAYYKDENGKQRKVVRDRSEWIPIKIPAILEREVWEAAQARMAANRRHVRRTSKYPYLMRSRLKCAVCGTTFQLDTEVRLNPPLQYYFCLGQKAYHSPDGKTLRCKRNLKAEIVDAAIWAYVREVLMEPEKILQAFRDKQQATSASIASITKRIEVIEGKIADNNAKHKQLIDDFLDKSAVSREALEAKAVQLNSMNLELADEANSLRAKLEQKVISEERIANALEWSKQVRQGIDNFTFEDKLSVINLLDVTGIVQRGETLEQDVIVVSGFLPTVELVPGALLNNALYSNDTLVERRDNCRAKSAPRLARISG
jgi:site-specific DNA recombinase